MEKQGELCGRAKSIHPLLQPPPTHTTISTHTLPPSTPRAAERTTDLSLPLAQKKQKKKEKKKKKTLVCFFGFFYCSMLLGTGGDQKLRLCVLVPHFCALLHGFRKKALCTTCDVSVKCRLDCRAVINVAFFHLAAPHSSYRHIGTLAMEIEELLFFFPPSHPLPCMSQMVGKPL